MTKALRKKKKKLGVAKSKSTLSSKICGFENHLYKSGAWRG